MEETERKSDRKDRKEPVSAPSSSTSSKSDGDPKIIDSKAADDDSDQTNVCSEKFNPLLALYSPTPPPLPFPNIKCLNNVAEYESFMKGGRGRAKPENVEKKRQKAMKGVVDPERIERLKKLMVNNPVSEDGESSGKAPRRRTQKPQKNVLTKMPLCKGSPLGELYRCVEERIRVKVHIRTFKGLRGVCSGFVVAFDKFWNMAMVDVDETYREPLLGEAFYHEKALTISRLFEKLNLQESNEPVKRQETQEKAARHLPANPKAASRGCSADMRADGRTAESELSEAVKGRQEKHRVPVKAPGPQAQQKKESQTYGKVHTRHINQLFIRGENVILVNPQPL
ncbi:U7 snRNA-associated Sm-like protein LSm11 [Leuresthes tenuis]|uniref:U7 snRNA-associated Sm-like protein LSm11 n=1 Tax=Leuresthes tenuis TaxID=355514 RepID=UPI003B501BA3